MTDDGGALTQALFGVRQTAGSAAALTPLRTFDVIVRIRHRGEHHNLRCRCRRMTAGTSRTTRQVHYRRQ